MKTYRIVEVTTGKTITEKNHRGDKTAKNWLTSLLNRGVISGVGVQLQRRIMTDKQAATLPPFANGAKQSPWTAILP